MDSRIRVLVAKPGLDGHDRGARVIAAALRDAGMEVVYTGLRASVPAIAAAAEQGAAEGGPVSLPSCASQHIQRRPIGELKRREAASPLGGGGSHPPAR